jgi:biopolymer transport protein ExbD
LRFERHLKLEYELNFIDIIPLINVIFLMLIFFMLTSSFIFPTGININLPRAITSEMIPDQTRTILISKGNKIFLNDKAVTLKELERVLRSSAGKNTPVLIRADRRTALGKIAEVWNLCRDIGLSRVNIATNQEQ